MDLVYRDGQGNARVIRGGPQGIFGVLGGNIEVEVDVPLQESKDAYEDGDTLTSLI